MESYVEWMCMMVCDNIFEGRSNVPARDMLEEVMQRSGRLISKRHLMIIGGMTPSCDRYKNDTLEVMHSFTHVRRVLKLKMPIQSRWSAAVVMRDGSVIVASWGDIHSRKMFVIPAWPDRDDAAVTETVLCTVRINYAVCVLHDGRVMISGGHQGLSSTVMDTIEFMDPVTKQWTLSPHRLPARMYGHCTTVIDEQRVLITGGIVDLISCSKASYIYLPGTGQLVRTEDMHVGREFHACVLLPDGNVLVTGGYSGLPGYMDSTDVCEVFSLNDGWYKLPCRNTISRVWHNCVISGKRIFVIGGTTARDGRFRFHMEKLDVGDDRKTLLTRLLRGKMEWETVGVQIDNDGKAIVAL